MYHSDYDCFINCILCVNKGLRTEIVNQLKLCRMGLLETSRLDNEYLAERSLVNNDKQ